MKPENNIRHIACTDTVNLTAYTYDRLIFANPWWNFAKVNGKSLSIFGSKCLDIRVRDLEVCTHLLPKKLKLLLILLMLVPRIVFQLIVNLAHIMLSYKYLVKMKQMVLFK